MTRASTTLEEFTGLLASAQRSAVHLELRDAYSMGDPLPSMARGTALRPQRT
ncbi:hypothetical protein [Actinomadura hibisca]|uniref:hypothetical protein n=1 Tax=Actinomadura hibisca TaxID=68565 RepID=UPI0012F9B963|nr:hypothetical protein [Actinomadura hibisca]